MGVAVAPDDRTIQRDIDSTKLSASQSDAHVGLYVQTMAAFLSWLAPRYETERGKFRAFVCLQRNKASDGGLHRRTPDIVAELFLGLDYFLLFAWQSGVLSEQEYRAMGNAGWNALLANARTQGMHQQSSDPAQRFLDLLRAALSSEKAHVAGKNGNGPDENPEAWGWRSRIVGTGEYQRQEWQPQGECIGYVDGSELYLIPDAAYNMAKHLGQDGGEGIALTAITLYKRLREAGLLRSVDTARQTQTIRRTLEGKQQKVLHLAASSLVSEEPDNSDISDNDA